MMEVVQRHSAHPSKGLADLQVEDELTQQS